jgi:hypothetical protein
MTVMPFVVALCVAAIAWAIRDMLWLKRKRRELEAIQRDVERWELGSSEQCSGERPTRPNSR